MGVVTLKSTIITNRDATPKVLTDPYVSGGEIRESGGYVVTGAADSAGSKYILDSIPSNAKVTSLILAGALMGTSAALDVGVFWPTFIPVGGGLSAANAGLAINSILFVVNQALSAALTPTDVINQSGNNGINNQELPIWQAAGLTSDPGIYLDIVAQVRTALGASGYIGLKTRYME